MKNLIWVGSLVLLTCCQTPVTTSEHMGNQTRDNFDWQGHRGARGLAPENSIPSFLIALSFSEITTLELDVVISKDKKVVVSHEPWISHHICAHPDGKPVSSAEEHALNLYEMTYSEIAAFDCGSRGNDKFPEQEAQKVAKPLLREMVAEVESHCKTSGRALPRYNIEIKSRPGWDNKKTPAPEEFARLVLEEINHLNLQNRVCVQSFDPRVLREVHLLDNKIVTALLVESNALKFEDYIKIMGYQPPIYSPNYKMVNKETIQMVRNRGMRIIPWTVNETEEMRALIALGVDGIITDYPDRIPK